VRAGTTSRHGVLNKMPIALVVPGMDDGGGGRDALASWVMKGGGIDLKKNVD